MIATLKAEFRKLFTVRSTYVILLIALALEILFAFYATAYHATKSNASDPLTLANEVIDSMTVLSTLASLIGVLLVTHEYRYNTIVYTLTAAKSRTQVLIAKIVAISCLVIVFSAVFSMLAPALADLGWHVRGLALVHQHFDFWNLLWRAVFAGWAFSMLALIIALLVRNQVGSIAVLLLFPGTVESLLGLILKNNQVYLPFSSINQVLAHAPEHLTIDHAVLVALAYIVGGWLIAWIFFLKRDAN